MRLSWVASAWLQLGKPAKICLEGEAAQRTVVLRHGQWLRKAFEAQDIISISQIRLHGSAQLLVTDRRGGRPGAMGPGQPPQRISLLQFSRQLIHFAAILRQLK